MMLTVIAVLWLVFVQSAAAKYVTLKEGDCLWNMALREYNDATLWTVLSEYNGIPVEKTRSIPAGTLIYVPDKSVITKFRDASTPEEKEKIKQEENNSRNQSTPAGPQKKSQPVPVKPEFQKFELETHMDTGREVPVYQGRPVQK